MNKLTCLVLCFMFMTNLVIARYDVNVLDVSTGMTEVIASGNTGPYKVLISQNNDTIQYDTITAPAIKLDYLLAEGSYTAFITNTYGCETVIDFDVACPLNIDVFLEGPFNANSGKMLAGLTKRGLLPGQTPVSNLVIPTPNGQPYSQSPWNYQGQEGLTWTDATYQQYEPDSIVDWVLVSLLEETSYPAQVKYQYAAVLDNAGIVHTCPNDIWTQINNTSFYTRVEHRNHMAVMTSSKSTLSGQALEFNFKAHDSFDANGTGSGQKELLPDVWVMFAGDLEQDDDVSYDISGEDKIIWENQNGIFDNYLQGDADNNGDVNGNDKIIWYNNFGISSRVPKN